MNTTTQPTIKFENPPINEIVCGIRFNPIEQLQSGHFGILWQKFRHDFPKTEDHDLIAPISQEDFENFDKLPLRRVWFIHRNENELVQVQRNRFLYNWRERKEGNEYPGYEKVINNFVRYLSLFQEFLVEENLGNIATKEYELTYIDLIPQGQGWENLGNLEKVFPNLLSLTGQGIPSTNVRVINWQTILDLPNGLGQLSIAIRSGQRKTNNQPLLLIQTRALSKGQSESMQAWFDAAHTTITELFLNLVSSEIQKKFWGRK
jgi:uncharacterized protein (TIGR04255 family)